ncbi:His-Xaa-Ser system protein HxsD [Marinobacter salsuginis]|uniref:His-Xaa-Ser system protein HxsD n=1 Tax=Marinobacter salsuginis TaxID=418719 RepID=UPI00273DFB80|nr:His-Xaa-Ser system protein HxsD [Marinobacter salsuginis]
MRRIEASDVTGASEELSAEIDLRVISLEALKKSCYRFSDSYYYSLSITDSGEAANVTFRVPESFSDDEKQELLQRFNRDALDQELREVVFQKTETVRNLILMNAFANTDLVEE